jgi:hypothetical protein
MTIRLELRFERWLASVDALIRRGLELLTGREMPPFDPEVRHGVAIPVRVASRRNQPRPAGR